MAKPKLPFKECLRCASKKTCLAHGKKCLTGSPL